MFKFHSLETKPKENKVYQKIYGERIKYLFWCNSDAILMCHIKKILDDSQPQQTDNIQSKGHTASRSWMKAKNETTEERRINMKLQHLLQQQAQ